MLAASYSLKLSEQRNPEDIEDVMASGSSKDVSNSGVSMEPVRVESKCYLKSATAWSRKESSSHPGSRGKLVSDDSLHVNPG